MLTFNIDFSNEQEKRMLLDEMENLQGIHAVTIKRKRKMVSNAQRRLYWAVYVQSYRQYLEQDQGVRHSLDKCHYFLKRRFLKSDVWDPHTGEVIGEEIRSIGDYGDVDVKEMADFMRQVHKFLTGLGIHVPELERRQ